MGSGDVPLWVVPRGRGPGQAGLSPKPPHPGSQAPQGRQELGPSASGRKLGPRAERGGGAHIELALHGGLVDPGEGTVCSAVTAGEVEELPEGRDAGPGAPRALHGEVLAEAGGRCCQDAGRLVQGRQGQRVPVAAVVAGVADQEARAGLQEDRSAQNLAWPAPTSPQDASPPAPA